MAVHFISKPPKGLTPRQKEIHSLMKSGYKLLTTEGHNYSVWLENTNGVKIPVNRRTVESMANKEVIKPDDSHSTLRTFCWILS